MSYDNKNGLKTSLLLFGLISSLLLVLFSRIGVFDPLYPQLTQAASGYQIENLGFFQRLTADWDFFLNIEKYREENQRLSEENAILATEVAKLKLALDDYSLISKQQSFNKDFRQEPVRVSRYLESQTEIFVNKGSEVGIKAGDIAVLSDNLIGVVTESNQGVAKVRLVTDKASKVPALVVETGSKGFATGRGVNTIDLLDVPNDKEQKAGFSVIAAGTDGVVPYGLVMGKLDSIVSDPTQINQSGTIRSLVKLNNLSQLFILIK